MNPGEPQPNPHDGRNVPLVRGEMPCGRCGYALNGQPISALCPECGTPIEETLQSTIDLKSPQSGPLPLPRTAGVSIILISACSIVLPLAAFVAALVGQFDTPPLQETTRQVLKILEWAVAIASGIGVLSMATLLLGTGRGEFQNGWIVTLTYGGFVAGIFAAMTIPNLGLDETGPTLMPQAFRAVWMLPVVAIAIGLSSMIKTLGMRSLRFKQGGGAVQGGKPLIWATIFQVVALGVDLGFRNEAGFKEVIGGIGQIVWFVASALVLVGFIYLYFNAIWAALPLLHSRHRLAELLELPSDETPDS